MNNNNKDKVIKNRKKSGGFTLVELLATIAILSLVSVIVMYTATNIIDNAKKKSYVVTINNIQKESGTYVLENDRNIVWLGDGSDYLYQCVTVQNLIDMGYFDNDILDSKVSDDRNVLANDYIYIEKDKVTKVITRQILLYDENTEFDGLCGDYVNAKGNILFDVPIGWATSKEITITYRLDDSISVGDSTNYRYGYDFLNDTEKYTSYGFTTLKTATRKITVFDEGTIYADIKGKDDEHVFSDSVDVGQIDTLGPNITDNASNETVRGSVTIPLKILDDKSGVDGKTISLSDFKVSIGGKELTSGVTLTEVNHDTDGEEINYYNYNLVISDKYYVGEVVIKINENQIKDMLGNGNKKIELSTGIIFKNTYTISYDKNNGTGSMADTICTYGVNCYLSKNTIKRDGYKFLGWSTDKNATSAMYDDEYKFEPFKLEDDMILYAIWKVHTYTIKYNANGGSGSMSNTTCTYDQNCTLTQNAFLRTGYTFNGWNTKTDGIGTSYKDSGEVKNLTTIAGDVITLYSQWNANTYTISYEYNGGKKGTNAPTSGTYDKVLTIDNPSKTVTVTGDENGTGATIGSATSKAQTFAGWTYSNGNTNTAKYGTLSNDVTCSWSSSSTKVTSKYFKNLRSTSGYVTLTANWTPVALNLPTISKTGYTCKWNTEADGSGTSYTSGGSYTPSATSSSSITMYAICTVNKVYINLHVNGGTLTDGTSTAVWSASNSLVYKDGNKFKQSISYGGQLGTDGLYNYDYATNFVISKTGYHGKSGAEWKCLSGCTDSSKTYSDSTVYSAIDFCDASNGDCTVVLGVNWEIDTYTISYNACSGSGAPSSQTKTYDEDLTLSSTKPTRDGYTFLGWSDASSCSAATSKNYDAGGTYRTNAGDMLYAVWRINKVYINYKVNGGTLTDGSSSTVYSVDSDGYVYGGNTKIYNSISYGGQMGTDGLYNYDYATNFVISKTGHHGKSGAEWKCLSGCTDSSKTYRDVCSSNSADCQYAASDFCDAKNGDCTVVLGVNWEKDTYTISYNACSGSGAPSSQTKTYGKDLTLSSTIPTRDGYKFVGWSTASSCSEATSKNYDAGGTYKTNAGDTLYAVWEANRKDKTETGVYIIDTTSNTLSCGIIQLRVSWRQVYTALTNSSILYIDNFEGKTEKCTEQVYWVGGEKTDTFGISINGTLVKEMSVFRGTNHFYVKKDKWVQIYLDIDNVNGNNIAIMGGELPYTSSIIEHGDDGNISVPIKVQLYMKRGSGNKYYAYFDDTKILDLTFGT